MLAMACAAGLAACTAPADRPPDIALVTWDTVRADHVGEASGPDVPYASAELGPGGGGAGVSPTPRLDALARSGVVFLDARSPVPITLPAHASLMTGLYPHHHGARDNGVFRVDEGLDTLAERLRAAGYATGAFVSAAVLDRSFGLAQGFDVYDDALDADRPQSTVAARRADRTVDAALAWIAGLPRDRPCFVWLHLYAAHRPWRAPAPYSERFDPYRAEIAFADAQTGRMLDGLRDAGRLDGALVVVTSDHGEGLGQHGEGTHSYFAYDSTLRVPLVFWAGRAREGLLRRAARIPGPASLVDVPDTLLALADVPPLHADGRSLEASVRRGEAVPPRVLPFESVVPALDYAASPVFGLLDEQGSTWYDGPRRERYDLASDPGQTRNLYRAADAGRAAALFAGEDRAWPPKAAPAALDPEMRARLEALGYATDADPHPPPAPEVDAKDRVEVFQFITLGAESLGLQETLERIRSLRARHGPLLALDRFEADTLTAMARPREALAVLERAAAAHPWAQGVRAKIQELRQREQRQRALVRAIRAELARNPDHPTAERDLALTLHQLEEWDEARRLYERVLERTPGDDETRANLARLLVARGEPELALERLAAGRARSAHAPALDCIAGRILEAQPGRAVEARTALEACAAGGGALDARGRALLAGSSAGAAGRAPGPRAQSPAQGS